MRENNTHHNTRAELDRQRLLCAHNGITDSQTSCNSRQKQQMNKQKYEKIQKFKTKI